jgi:hypothetical protein
LSINSEAEELLAGFLGILGMALFFLPQA